MPSRWAVVELCGDSATRFRDAWRAADGPRFLTWLAGGAVSCAALSAGLTLLGRALAEGGRFAGEAALIRRFAEDGPMSFQLALFLSQPGSSAMMIPVALVGAWIAVRAGRAPHAVALMAAALVIKAVVGLGWLLWARDRPDLVAGGLAAPEGLSSYPSGHVAQTVAFYGLLTAWWSGRSRSMFERSLTWLALTVLVGATAASRLRLGAHWPSDLVAGAAVGAAWVGVSLVALRRAVRA